MSTIDRLNSMPFVCDANRDFVRNIVEGIEGEQARSNFLDAIEVGNEIDRDPMISGIDIATTHMMTAPGPLGMVPRDYEGFPAMIKQMLPMLQAEVAKTPPQGSGGFGLRCMKK